MRRICSLGLTLGIVALSAIGSVLYAAEPAAGPMTLWKFLGIPQNVQKARDATRNRSGDRPNRERVPPPKRIADPANLESKNPAIKAAAEVKADQDLCEQKVKAIKYLASVGCGCYPQVRAALLAALDDCSEEIRYQAAMAFAKAAGDPCEICDASCCNAEVMTKLNDLAFGQDAKGCPKEASPRVRAAATKALNSCKQRNPAGPTPATKETPEKKELPIEAQPQPGTQELPNPPAAVTPAPSGTPAPPAAPGSGAAYIEDEGTERSLRPSADDTRASGAPDLFHATGFARVEEARETATTEVTGATEATPTAFAGRCPCGQPRCAHVRRGMVYVPGVCPVPPQRAEIAPGEARPGETRPGEAAPGEVPPAEQPTPSPSALAGTVGGAAGPASAAPNMIGDFFAGGAVLNGAGILGPAQNVSAGVAGGDRRFKIVEANSPIPTDRVFFNYNHFQNPLQDAQGNARNLERFTFGAEKTLRNGLYSIELRVPFDSGFNPNQSLAQDASLSGSAFGDVALAIKRVIYRRENVVVAGGLGIVFPTGANWTCADANGTIGAEIRNEAVYLQPFLGLVWTPNDRLFCESSAQLDFDTGGNTVLMTDASGLSPLAPVGRLRDQHQLYLDMSVGYWIYRNPCAHWLTGLAPVVELHYTTALQDGFAVTGGTGTIGEVGSDSQPIRRDALNITGGFHFQLGPLSTLTVAGVAPLRTAKQTDKLFDAEFLTQFTRRF